MKKCQATLAKSHGMLPGITDLEGKIEVFDEHYNHQRDTESRNTYTN